MCTLYRGWTCPWWGKKKSEKARLRKGLNVLVATPGRLVDHLDNTKALDVSNVRWLILDEGDRLVDLGFEEDITRIVKTLDHRKEERETRGTTKWPGLPVKRTTVLCSATLKMNVQKLGEISLKDAMLIKGDAGPDDLAAGDSAEGATTNGNSATVDSAFLAPAQLKQSYVVAAAKLRFVTLTALLKRTFARKGSVMKAIVFVSCADSVEFHFKAFTSALDSGAEDEASATNPRLPLRNDSDIDSDTEAVQKSVATGANSISPTGPPPSDSHAPSHILSSNSNPLTIYKLHGSLPQPIRTSTLNAFTNSSTPSVLLATDVAARGLDLPNLDLVIEYDPSFSAEDHLHRIGRTARLGRDGRAIIFLLPGKEEGYIDVLKSSYRPGSDNISNVSSLSSDEVLKKGFAASSGVIATKKDHKEHNSKAPHWETQATELQLSLERFILATPAMQSLARKAFQSHIRAYATHTATERKFFDIKDLHLGHLCKSFGLRDTPSGMGAGRGTKGAGKGGRRMVANGDASAASGDKRKRGGDETGEVDEAARKMREKIRKNRKMMNGAGADEFNIA